MTPKAGAKGVATALAMLATSLFAQEPPWLVGIWKAEESVAAVGSAVAYLAFAAQHTCAQVAKGKIFGMTKWQVVECKWALDGDSLTMTVTGPASEKGNIGKVSKFTVGHPSADALTLTARDDVQNAIRVTEVPAEFAAKSPVFAAAVASPK